MPPKKQTQYNEYNKYLNSSIRGNSSSGAKVKQLKNLQYYLEKLNKEITKCYEKDRNDKYRPIGTDRLKKIKNYYKLCDFYASKAEKEAKDQHLSGSFTSELHKILKEDEAYVSCLTQDDILPEKFRRNVVTVDSTNLHKVGNSMSARIPITFTDENGQKVSGFFTETSSNNTVDKETYSRHRRETDEIEAKLAKDRDNPDLKAQYEAKVHERESNPGLTQAVACGRAGIKLENNITDRNCAMSKIANLLGLDRLLANSHSMTVYDEKGNEKKGVFMATSTGVTYENLNHIPYINQSLERNLLKEFHIGNSDFRKDLADLQILDFICGNIDRHYKNMTYIFDYTSGSNPIPFLAGIQGIDNDLSMGIINPIDKGISNLPALKNIQVISESLATKITNMKQEDLEYVLKGLDLTADEITAAWQRTQAIKDRLTTAERYTDGSLSRSNITIVPDTAFFKIPRDRLNKGYFKTIKGLHNRLQKDFNEDTSIRQQITNGEYKDKPVPAFNLNYNENPVSYTEAKLTQLYFSDAVISKNKASVETFKTRLEDLARNSKTGEVEIETEHSKRTAYYKNVYRAIKDLENWYANYDAAKPTNKQDLKDLFEKTAAVCMDYISEHNPHSAIGKQRQKAMTDILEFIGTQGIMINEYHDYVDKKLSKAGILNDNNSKNNSNKKSLPQRM